MPRISRRQLLLAFAAAGGHTLLSACRNTAAPPVTVTPVEPVLPSPTGPPTVTPQFGVYFPAISMRATPTQAATQTIRTPTRPAHTPTPRPTPTPTPEPCLTPGPPPPEEDPLVGLHASADPAIQTSERCTFIDLRPSLIKVLSFHPADDIAKLAATQPNATWIVRTFLEFGGRRVEASDFVNWTLNDTRRTVSLLAGRPHVLELHNEPNLVREGWGASWADGREFADWFLPVLNAYRVEIPGVPLLYPGLSPGDSIGGARRDSTLFLQESAAAVEAADGLGAHVYWSADFPMGDALAQLDRMISRFPTKPVWITEASYNRGGIDDVERARQYLAFIEALESRPTVQGVTFFVASASDPTFSAETWVGKELGVLLGARE